VSTERMNNLKVVTSCTIEQDVWFDYVENELDSSLKKDLGLHLQSCPRCQQSYSEFKGIRRALKKIPETALPAQNVFDALENKIMASLGKKIRPELAGPSGAKAVPAGTGEVTRRPFGFRRLTVPVAAAAALAVLVLGSLFKAPSFRGPTSISQVQNSGKNSGSGNLEDQIIVQTASNNPESFGDTIVGHQESDDIVMDAAADKLGRMSDNDAQAMLDNLK
jgi:hypothetical protein